jgi:predicted RNA-binding protein with PUA-like domain
MFIPHGNLAYYAGMNYWLMKSEPSEVSVDDMLKRKNQTVPWFGVRNYLARNYMRDLMQLDDGVLFYHSSCPEPGIAGIARVSRLAYPDETQFDAKSKYHDPKASRDKPRWLHVDVQLLKKTRLLGLEEMRANPDLAQMMVLRKGNRLSITPVTAEEWKAVGKLLKSS